MLCKQINELTQVCSDAEKKLVQKMIWEAADYVQAVIRMVTTDHNVAGLDTQQWKADRQTTDKARTVAHDSLISMVNIVNRICARHEKPLIYQGSESRKEYGDFAIELVRAYYDRRY